MLLGRVGTNISGDLCQSCVCIYIFRVIFLQRAMFSKKTCRFSSPLPPPHTHPYTHPPQTLFQLKKAHLLMYTLLPEDQMK